MTTYLKFINPFKRYPGHLIGTAACTLFYVVFNALSLWLVAPVLKVIFLPNNPNANASPVPMGGLSGWYESLKTWSWDVLGGSDPVHMLPRLCVALIIVFLIKNLFGYGQLHFVSYVEQKMIKDLRDTVFAHVARLPYSYFDRRPTGEVMSNVMNDVAAISITFQRVFTQLLRDPLTVITLLIVLISISWKMTLMALLIVPLFGVIYKWTGQSLKRKSWRIQERLGNITSHLQEAISGARVIKAFGTERREAEKFEAGTQELFRQNLRLARLERLAPPLSESIGVFIIALVLFFGGQQVLTGSGVDAEDFIRFIVVLFSILAPARNLGSVMNSLQIGAAAGVRIEEVLNEKPEPVQTGSTAPIRFEKAIVFDRVHFRYETSNEWVLRDINLIIHKNEKIALVGRSGSGKSTLANLIPRFYEPQQGLITVDGQPLKELPLTALRSQVSTVSQDVFLFNDTVRNNICYGLSGVEDARLQEAIERSHSGEFIRQLPHGLETMVGERGTQLSGGQKQRIAIARALLRDSPILIFDEATSALDAESERFVQKALDELFLKRTVIIIAHRLTSVRHADRIVVMDKGKISDMGSHTELLRSSALYAMLTRLFEHGADA
ncbi:MAG TPA: ABC transporter ATP-binding protein [bacterium]|jgi:subfamily B ATP-binding cassette protein MsbA